MRSIRLSDVPVVERRKGLEQLRRERQTMGRQRRSIKGVFAGLGLGMIAFIDQAAAAHYALAPSKSVALTGNYQFITNPAYNGDRGPISILSARPHGEF